MLTNTGWNLAGLGAPILAAIIAMPLLISQLGDARFGILALGWMVTGYFALFDFGVGRATTRSMAALRSAVAESEHAAVFWNSLYVHAALALIGGLVFAAAVPWFVDTAFAIPPALRDEAYAAFYWLAFSVPALVLASALRGPLEAEHRFDLVNAVKMPISALNYLAPLLALQFTHRVDAVIAVIALSRWLATLAYGVLCRRAVQLQPGRRGLCCGTAMTLLKDGGWLTVASIAVPVIMMLDRSLIARLVSIESITYYVVPYELVTKMWVLSASIMGATYPLMAAGMASDVRGLCTRSTRWLLVAATPAALIAIVFARDLLHLWVGEKLAVQAAPVMQYLALGVWMNVLAQVPLTALQATGRARVVGVIQLIELPLYAVVVWVLVSQWGVAGAAFAWGVRAALEWLALSLAFNGFKRDRAAWSLKPMLHFVLLAMALLCSLQWGNVSIALKLLAGFASTAALVLWQWRTMLTTQERWTIRRVVRSAMERRP